MGRRCETRDVPRSLRPLLPVTEQFPANGRERRWIDETTRLDHGFIQEAGCDSEAADPGSPGAKDVPVLRVNHVAVQSTLPGVREVAQRDPTGATRRKMSLSNRACVPTYAGKGREGHGSLLPSGFAELLGESSQGVKPWRHTDRGRDASC